MASPLCAPPIGWQGGMSLPLTGSRGGWGEKPGGSQVMLHSRTSHPIFFIITWRASRPMGLAQAGRQPAPLAWRWAACRGGQPLPPLRTDPAISEPAIEAETLAAWEGGQDAPRASQAPRGSAT